MEIWVMAYAKSDIIKAVKNAVGQSGEIQVIEEKLVEPRMRYQAISARYDREIQEMKPRVRSQMEFKEKLYEINKRADAELEPILAESSKLQKTIDELEIKLFAEYLSREVAEEIFEIRKAFENLNMKNVKDEKPIHRGKLGLAGVLNIRFDADKAILKELKKKLGEKHFRKIEVMVETL